MFDFFKNLFGSESGTKRRKLSSWERKKILERQKNRCAMCGRKLKPEEYHFDHKKPLALGGKDDISNIQALCPNCHHIKTKRDRHRIAKEKKKKPKIELGFDLPKVEPPRFDFDFDLDIPALDDSSTKRRSSKRKSTKSSGKKKKSKRKKKKSGGFIWDDDWTL